MVGGTKLIILLLILFLLIPAAIAGIILFVIRKKRKKQQDSSHTQYSQYSNQTGAPGGAEASSGGSEASRGKRDSVDFNASTDGRDSGASNASTGGRDSGDFNSSMGGQDSGASNASTGGRDSENFNSSMSGRDSGSSNASTGEPVSRNFNSPMGEPAFRNFNHPMGGPASGNFNSPMGGPASRNSDFPAREYYSRDFYPSMSKPAFENSNSSMSRSSSATPSPSASPSRTYSICPCCGSRLNLEHPRFCPKCGQKLYKNEILRPYSEQEGSGQLDGAERTDRSTQLGEADRPELSAVPEEFDRLEVPAVPILHQFFRQERAMRTEFSYMQKTSLPPESSDSQNIPAILDRSALHTEQNDTDIPAAPVEHPSETTKPPALDLDKVHFSAVAPDAFTADNYFLVEIFMYEDAFRTIVDSVLTASAGTLTEKTTSGVVRVHKKSRIRVLLTSPDLVIPENEEEQEWQGEYLRFTFAANVPSDYKKDQILFYAKVFIEGFLATRLVFCLDRKLKEQPIEIDRRDISSAFISYASQDRQHVATIVQGMKSVLPKMDVFFDIQSLRSGEYWENILFSEIDKRDIFFLCWSHFAQESPWVDKEWRHALKKKGLDFIEPIPIESPEHCPPPAELSQKHFNDTLLYIINQPKNDLGLGI